MTGVCHAFYVKVLHSSNEKHPVGILKNNSKEYFTIYV